jgi:hypothetical protein
MSAAAPSCRRRFSPQGRWNTVPPGDVQRQLRRAFARWGRPGQFRVDNGTPWGSSGDLPPDLALWLLGLDVGVQWNEPRRPEQNGVVERSQGTGKRWAEPQTCTSPAELQRRLAEVDTIQRERYPSIQGQSRQEAFPQLRHSRRSYSRAWERAHWSLGRVLAQLSGCVVSRRVDKSGMVSLYNRTHYVGKVHAGKDVYVQLDPVRREWVFVDARGQQLRVQPAEQLTRERIERLEVTVRR